MKFNLATPFLAPNGTQGIEAEKRVIQVLDPEKGVMENQEIEVKIPMTFHHAFLTLCFMQHPGDDKLPESARISRYRLKQKLLRIPIGTQVIDLDDSERGILRKLAASLTVDASAQVYDFFEQPIVDAPQLVSANEPLPTVG